MQARLIVIIVSWNVRRLLLECLRTLPAGADGLPLHTVVFDNASSDGTVQAVRERYPDVEVIASDKNLGFSRANNIVLRKFQHSADYFLLLNPDTVVRPGTLRIMAEFMGSHPEAGVAGCKIVKPDGTLDWPCKRSYITPSALFYKACGLDRMFPNSPRFGRYHLTFLDPDQLHEVDALVGAFMMIRRECLAQIGLLDEALFMYGEDLEWCYRAKSAGWRVYYVPAAEIIHYKGQSSGRRSYRMIYWWYHSTWQTYRKCVGPRYPRAVNVLVWLGFHVMCAGSLVANLLKENKRVPGRR